MPQTVWSRPDGACPAVAEDLGWVGHGLRVAQQDLSGCPCGGARIEDIIDGGMYPSMAKISGNSDADIGEQRTPVLGARPRRLPRCQWSPRQSGKTDLWMDLDDLNRGVLHPPLYLEQFRFEPESLDEIPCPVRSRLIAEAAAWSAASNAWRTGVMNTDGHSGPTAARASTSA